MKYEFAKIFTTIDEEHQILFVKKDQNKIVVSTLIEKGNFSIEMEYEDEAARNEAFTINEFEANVLFDKMIQVTQ